MLLAFSFLISPFPRSTENKLSANSAGIELVNDSVLQYVSISTAGLPLTKDKLMVIDSDNDGKDDTSYIVANGTISLLFKPFEFNYSETSFDDSLFYKSTITQTLTKDVDGNFPTSFEYGEDTINYQRSATDVFTFKLSTSPNSVNSQTSDFVNVEITEEELKFEFTTSYTLRADAPSTSFSFTISTQQYTLNFERPIVDFKTDYVTYFTCKDLEAGDISHSEIIERELSFENVKIQFTNNNYTKNNPLYFDINYNGFVYTFTLYSENDLLFVEYFDDQRPQNNRSLASVLNEDGTSVITSVSKFISGSTTDFNLFSIDFNKTGRYEISVYDSTYLLLKNQPTIITPEDEDPTDDLVPEPEIIPPEENPFNYNFYQTSFYIKTNDVDGDSAFQNAYAIMQSYDDSGNYLDYIVSQSTQNNNVKITLKNLSYYFKNDSVLKNFQATDEIQDLDIVEFRKTTLAGSSNIPQPTFYSLSQLKEALETNNDFHINCTEDAFYELIIYKYNDDYSRSDKFTYYQFTIVKQPKISFTVYEVDEHNDPIPKPGSSPVKYKTIIREADTPYETVEATYKMNINSSMDVSIFFCDKLIPNYGANNLPFQDEIKLPKTYLNEYVINFAMQAVDIQKVDIPDPNDSQKTLNVLGLQFFGVGDIVVKVSFNSITSTYTVKSGDTLTFEAYGTYSVAIEDSMGTMGTAVFEFKEPVSISSILLIALAGLIVLAIVLIIISSRGKIKTR